MEHPARNSFNSGAQPIVQDVVIMLGDGATLADCSAITQPMLTMNEISGRRHYRWHYASLNGSVQKLACGAELSCDADVGQLHHDTLVVLNWGSAATAKEDKLIAWVRRQYRVGNKFILQGNAVFTLARAGLLSDIPVAVHWEWMETMKELYPNILAVDQLYSVSPRICASTCSDAATELVVGLIETRHGREIASKVQEQLNRPACRPPTTPQSIPLARKYGSRNQTFLAVVERIQSSYEEDISVQDLCCEFNISRRQLERQFAEKTGTSPLRFIKDHRLRKAQKLLQITNMSVLEVAIACGFQSDSCFRTAFKRKFGVTPKQFV
ncbi:GlxA family transcriptional regulator [Cognatishimia maritima]|uniref:AraC family transcriptional regulator, carnitine catabolism transcriptional activator n=1 Tax=Cognatishimia maritima TaxID=870908 RepID=A0A1M5QRW7_9RHOB|nr:helix-turn-helix domain-containing protein [Cognatishimia maritima]SHH16895.1 AraC family transcriptional regulator, carnitine catabolism transcriptional activator [Cognatishimia maritima]